jgi:porphobilinogen synthase
MAASPVCFRPHVGLRFSGSASVNNSSRAQFGDGACFGHLVFAPCKGRESSSRNRNSSSSSVRAIAEPVIRKPAPPTIEECEAAVVAGNPPPAPPVPAKPKAPEGTPVITPLTLTSRPRRNRRSPALRAAFQETLITPANFILPLFVHEGEQNTPIGAMPGCYRLGWRHGLIDEVGCLESMLLQRLESLCLWLCA